MLVMVLQFDIKFNQAKCFLFHFGLGKNVVLPARVLLYGIALKLVARLKYLEVTGLLWVNSLVC